MAPERPENDMPRRVNHILVHKYRAAEILAAKRLVIIDPTDTNEVRYPEADSDAQLIGITIDAAAAINDMVQVCVMGFAELTVDGNAANIAIGDLIQAHDTAGYGRKVLAVAGTNYECIGFAMEASTADGDVISVQIAKQVHQVANP